MTDKMREEFEKSPPFRGMDFTRSATHPEFYDSPYANGAWDGWQASREALVITLPNTECFGEYSQEAARVMRDSCADAIEEQGIKFEVSE